MLVLVIDLYLLCVCCSLLISRSRISPISSDPKKVSELDVYKIFTQHKPLTELEVDNLFEYHSEFTVIDWLAYPEYDKIPNDVKVSTMG